MKVSQSVSLCVCQISEGGSVGVRVLRDGWISSGTVILTESWCWALWVP